MQGEAKQEHSTLWEWKFIKLCAKSLWYRQYWFVAKGSYSRVTSYLNTSSRPQQDSKKVLWIAYLKLGWKSFYRTLEALCMNNTNTKLQGCRLKTIESQLIWKALEYQIRKQKSQKQYSRLQSTDSGYRNLGLNTNQHNFKHSSF